MNAPSNQTQPRAEDGRPIHPMVAGIILAAVLCLKLMAVLSLRVDSDETQHAHVVWGWTTGRLQYRDVFDNHMPLFHMLCAPYFALFGDDPNILLPLRLAMLPLFGISLWCIYRLGAVLYSKRAGWWTCLVAALAPVYFYTSTEFRTDDLWTLFWFLSLVVAISGEFTLKRAFMLGILLGLTTAISTKTVFLGAALSIAAGFAFGLRAWLGRERLPLKPAILSLLAIGCGGVIFPGAIAIYFAARGAFKPFFYCVFEHNMVPGLKRWSDISYLLWIFPITLPFLAAFAVYIFRRAPTAALATRRILILLTPYLFAGLMFSYCPDLTRQDNLPYVPLLPVTLVPFLVAIHRRWPRPRVARAFFSYALPAFILAEIFWTARVHDLRGSGLHRVSREITTIFSLTDKGDYVMEDKGNYIFRDRPFYWGLEPVTRTRIKMRLIQDDIPQRLEATDTRVSYLLPMSPGTVSEKFIVANYMPFDPLQPDIGVAGKTIGAPRPGESCQFEVAIAAPYAVLSETGETAGKIDGADYHDSVQLNPGIHQFVRTSGGGRLAIFLSRAAERGLRPLFDESAELIDRMNKHAPRGD